MKFRIILESKKSAKNMYGDKLGETKFQELVELDPSPSFKYIEFLCRMAIQGHSISFDQIDDYYIADKKNHIDTKNINKESYTYNDFTNDLKSYLKKQNKKGIEKDIDVIYEDDEVKVLIPNTWESSKKYGANTKWCTTSRKTRAAFDMYTDSGFLYYVLFKSKNAKYEKIAVQVWAVPHFDFKYWHKKIGIYSIWAPTGIKSIYKGNNGISTKLLSEEASINIEIHFETHKEAKAESYALNPRELRIPWLGSFAN